MRAEERNCSPKLWKAASGNTSVCERVFAEAGEIRRKAAEAKKKLVFPEAVCEGFGEQLLWFFAVFGSSELLWGSFGGILGCLRAVLGGLGAILSFKMGMMSDLCRKCAKTIGKP